MSVSPFGQLQIVVVTVAQWPVDGSLTKVKLNNKGVGGLRESDFLYRTLASLIRVTRQVGATFILPFLSDL